jgi:hypothetical protein
MTDLVVYPYTFKLPLYDTVTFSLYVPGYMKMQAESDEAPVPRAVKAAVKLLYPPQAHPDASTVRHPEGVDVLEVALHPDTARHMMASSTERIDVMLNPDRKGVSRCIDQLCRRDCQASP